MQDDERLVRKSIFEFLKEAKNRDEIFDGELSRLLSSLSVQDIQEKLDANSNESAYPDSDEEVAYDGENKGFLQEEEDDIIDCY